MREHIHLSQMMVEKPWGRTNLPLPFFAPHGRRVGEIWFQDPAETTPMALLVKYLFTSENLSIQVHPDDDDARARGLAGGKEECWYILAAEPGALLGVGTTRPLEAEEIREAASNGALPHLMQWHNVEPGMLFHIPAGTVHAIGAGIMLLEVQQNRDITYRLYDYGRPRDLHLADGSEVARAFPFPSGQQTIVDPTCSAILLEARHFTIAQITDDDFSLAFDPELETFLIPIAGEIWLGRLRALPGDCVRLGRDPVFRLGTGARALLAWST